MASPCCLRQRATCAERASGVLLVPLAAWWLSVSYWQALLLDLGFFVFFLPYTYVFNWGYDTARAAWVRRRQAMTVPS